MPMKTNNLVACPECDALSREPTLAPGGIAACGRCGAELFRSHPDSLDHTLAWLIAAAVVFLCANAVPLMELDAQGIRSESTLMGTVVALQETGWPVLSVLVLLTVIVVPFLQLAVALGVLVPLKLGFVPAGARLLARTLDAIWPWGMVEVFLLGAMVSLVKLRQIAHVEPGWALYLVGGYVLLIAAAVSAFEPRSLWHRFEELAR
jgi:paraquat-inducible protein A